MATSLFDGLKHLLPSLREESKSRTSISGLRSGAAALLTAQLVNESGRPALCLVASEKEATLLEQNLGAFTNHPIMLYPAYDIPPYTPLSPDPGTIATRLATLYRVMTGNNPFLMVATAESLLRRVLPRERLANLAELLIKGEETNQDELAVNLIAAGYESVALVQNIGEFSRRGDIFDVFSPGLDYPVRLDFFGDTVEAIRLFHPITQRSVETIDEVVLLPASDILFPAAEAAAWLNRRFEEQAEISAWDEDQLTRILNHLERRNRFPGIEFFLPLFYDTPTTPLDFLPPETLLVAHDPMAINRVLSETWEKITENHAAALAGATPALPPETLFVTEKELAAQLHSYPQINLHDFPLITGAEGDQQETISIESGGHGLLKQDLELNRKKAGGLAPLTRHIHTWLDQGDQVIFACRTLRRANHLADLLGQHNMPVAVFGETVMPFPVPNAPVAIRIHAQPLVNGFDLPADHLHILSETELFGEIRLGPKKKQKKGEGEPPVRFEELNLGDIVVHSEHGLGVYEGMVNMEVRGVMNDFLQIAYQGSDRLYVPVDRMNTITKYKGISDQDPKLDKLGGKSWGTAKQKVTQAVWRIAQDLLELYAKRELLQGTAFSGPDELYHELEESFPFDETPGQHKAITDVIADIMSDKPMDRLVCGDVGYGKTEVAVRAAFKVVGDGYQVAVLVPTTVLAEQHAETFRERLQGFPVEVRSLNRFRTQAEQHEIVKGISDGKVDIVIGTHRLLSKDIIFRRLGLLIIDEEHRFGVTHKEKVKKLKEHVDVLTLTATPIPRTLQLSLLGIRDLSVINTPPEHRRTVKTFVARFDEMVIKEAVVKELQRGGQVFIVHNRVQSIHEMAHKVQRLVPSARIAVAHGQMPPRALEDIMVRFVQKEIDVLVCTTIIESGLDIQNANTIIITRADRLGLAEIYQLRGRVGRGREQAYAYLLVPSLDGLSKDAQQRLRALMDYNELGGGFKLALSDLQIRGGGNILGESQSGHIAAVGYDLYLDLLQKTVEDLKQQAASGQDFTKEETVDPEISLLVSAYLPGRYIASPDQRYLAYRRISGINNGVELLDMQEELIDRYGKLPAEAENLFRVIELKMELQKFKITRLEQSPTALVFTFHDKTPIAPQQVLAMINRSKNTVRFTPDSRLIVPSKAAAPEEVFNAAHRILRELVG